MQVAVISLEDAQQRRKLLLERGLPHSWVEGFCPASDRRHCSPEELLASVLYQRLQAYYQRPLLPGELGCLESHLAAITTFAQQEGAANDWLLVLEDDVVPRATDLLTCLDTVVEFLSRSKLASSPLVCHLGPKSHQQQSAFARPLIHSRLNIKPNIKGLTFFQHLDTKRPLWGGFAYLLNRAAAWRYLQAMDRWTWLADDWLGIKQGLDLQLLFITPGLFGYDEHQPSYIAPTEENQALRSGQPPVKKFYSRWRRLAVAGLRWLPAQRI